MLTRFCKIRECWLWPRCRPVIAGGLMQLLLVCLLPMPSAAVPDPQLQTAIEMLERQDYSRAIELLHDLQSGTPDPGRIDGLLTFALLGRGYQALAAGDFSAARASFQEGRRHDGEDVRFWQGEAMTSFRQGHYAEAATLLEQALGIAPQSAELYHQLGLARYAEGRMAEAVDALARAKERGGSEEISALLEKVRREWLLEQQMGQEVRGHFQLSFVDGGQAAGLAADILETLEDAYAELGSELAYYPDVRVPVLLYAHQDFSSVTGSPDWAGAVYDGKIRLPLGGMNRMSDPLAALLYHEYAHVLVHFMANRNAPVWLNEGLAEVAGRRRFSPPLQAVQRAIETDELIRWETLAGPFTGLTGEQIPLAYEQSHALVKFMLDSYGWHKMAELLGRLGGQRDWQAAIAAVYHDYGLDWPAILAEWRASQGS